ncbi:MAG TPA: hypothetical protein VI136_22915 [Verrucomicrobiae bacterium]
MMLGGNSRKFLRILGLAVVAYGVCFGFIQYRRTANGPWQVTFTGETGVPVLVVNQDKLGIADVRIAFPGQAATTNATQTIRFDQAKPVPFDLPFGKCVFLDPLFLPGTVALEAFGHQIQFMPRVLTIDRMERVWRSGETIFLTDVTGSSARLP